MTTTALHQPSAPIQLSLVGPDPVTAPTPHGADAVAWQLGFDHARHGLPLPTAHLHAASPLFAGWQAALARRLNRHRDPAPAQRQWLALRLRAWTEGVTFEDQLLTPHYLQQLQATHCPVTRQELHDEHGHPAQRCFARLRQDHGYAAGHLVQLSATAATALAGRSRMALEERAHEAASSGKRVDGLDAAAWSRLVSLVAWVSPATGTEVMRVLPPNRLHLPNPLMALQAWVTRQLAQPGWSQRLMALHDALPGATAREAARALNAALAPHALQLPGGPEARRWALEDLWLDGRVQRRWHVLAAQVSPLTVERLLRQLPPPEGWVVEHHARALGLAA